MLRNSFRAFAIVSPLVSLMACGGSPADPNAPTLGATIAAGVQKVQADVSTFEQKAAPVVANACAELHKAEANPLVNVALLAGTAAANAATGGAAGPVIAFLRDDGDTFCANGPPSGDTTTPAQQAAWLQDKITGAILSVAGAN